MNWPSPLFALTPIIQSITSGGVYDFSLALRSSTLTLTVLLILICADYTALR